MDPITAMAIVGTGLQVYGQIKSSQAQASLLRQQAQMEEIRIGELLQRLEINNEVVRERSQQAMGDIQARTGGASISSGSVLQGMEEVARLAAREIAQQTREATFEARMSRYEIDSMRSQAKEIEKAGYLSAFSSALMGGAKTYNASPGSTKPSAVRGSGATTSGSAGMSGSNRGISLLSAGEY